MNHSAARRSMDDHSWIHASTMEHAYQSWSPQEQSLAREIHELSLTNKDQSRELARALERSQQLEVSLNASNQAHCNFENLAERSRSELEQAYLGAMDREVNMANQVLVQESQLQAHQASEILEQRIAGVTSQAQAAMANMAASSDQRLAEAAQESQQRVHLVQQWAEHNSAEMQKELGSARDEGSTLKQQMARATAENDQLRLALAQATQKSQAAETLNLEMAKRLEDKDLLLATASEEQNRLQAIIQEGKAYVSNLDGQLQNEKAKTALLESTVESMKTEMQAFKEQLDVLMGRQKRSSPKG